ncbi:unnamed protein product, partial [Allacma fusca]
TFLLVKKIAFRIFRSTGTRAPND